jgi:ribosomal protein S18 acetylase RimI-like enzyme
MSSVRRWSPSDREACLVIVRGLPDFFTEDVPETVRRDLAEHPAWVVTDDGTVAGFAVVKETTPTSAELLWAVVAAASRNAGLGRVLVDAVLAELAAHKVLLVEAKTVDASAGPPHDGTCAFWESAGFVQIDTIDPLPGWQPGNPSAIYVAALGPTRPPADAGDVGR